MAGISTFTFPGHQGDGFETVYRLRMVRIDGEPWFVAADVCKVLGTHVRDANRLLDEDEKGVDTIHTPGGEQQVSVVNEPGLYSLILRSRKPEAKRFKRWVTHEVLPTIRKTGGYMTPGEVDLHDPDQLSAILSESLKALEREREMKPRTTSAVIAEEEKRGQLLWELRTAMARRINLNNENKIMRVAEYVGCFSKNENGKYEVGSDWRDILFASEVTCKPDEDKKTYTYANGPVRVYPGKQDEFLDRFEVSYQRKLFA